MEVAWKEHSAAPITLFWKKRSYKHIAHQNLYQFAGIGPLSQSLAVLRSVDKALCEAEGTILWWVLLKGSVKSLALAQTLSRLHSSGASCPMLSRLTPTEAPEATKDLLCWPLLTLAPWHLLERRGRLQKSLIMLTPQHRTHLQTTEVYILSL